MKGLLLKDAYQTLKYCRAYLLVVLFFIIATPLGGFHLFMLFYPCLLASMVPVNLTAYDAQSKWEQYAATLPYSRSQLVSAKYLIGLFTSGGVLTLTGIAQLLRMVQNGNFQLQEFGNLLAALLIVACVVPSITLPLIFRFGPEKGRILYLVIIGLVCGGSAAASIILSTDVFSLEITDFPNLLPACLAAIGLYAASWYLSIVFYRKREIQ